MYSICYESRLFKFVSRNDCLTADQTAIAVRSDEVLNPANLVQKVENNNTLYIISDDEKSCYDNFCSQFPVVRAGGGLIENGQGAVLMIYRKGWWDLPKGHLESGETIEQCAKRECEEESGLDGRSLSIVAPLTVTRHFHCAYNRWEIKESHWFLMQYNGRQSLTPEAQEQITEAKWLIGDELWECVKQSYTTIREVFDSYLKYKTEQ